MELELQIIKDGHKTIVRDYYDVRNALVEDDPDLRDLELLEQQVIAPPTIEPFWRRLFR